MVVWRLGARASRCAARGCLETNKTSSHLSPGEQVKWNLCSGGPYRAASDYSTRPSASAPSTSENKRVWLAPCGEAAATQSLSWLLHPWRCDCGASPTAAEH